MRACRDTEFLTHLVLYNKLFHRCPCGRDRLKGRLCGAKERREAPVGLRSRRGWVLLTVGRRNFSCGFSDHRIINPHNHLSLFSKTCLILFQSRYKYSTCWFTPQTCTAARAGLKGGVSAGSPAYGAEALTHEAPSAGRELAGQVKQLGCDPAPIWDTGAASDGGSSFAC